MEQSMDMIVDIILLLFALEIIATILFIIFIYVLKVFKWFTRNDKEELRENLEKIILFRIEDKTPLSKPDLKVFKEDSFISLKVAEHFDEKNQPLSYWKHLRQQIINEIFVPKMRKFYKSSNMIKRYKAAKLFLYYFEESDTQKVLSLIEDPALFIAVTASRVGFKFTSDILINSAIDIFYHFRRLQKSVLSSIAADSSVESRNIVIMRLFNEKDAYIKCFCYSIMMQFPIEENLPDKFTRFVKTVTTHILPPFQIVQHLSEAIPRDLDSNVLDLRMAALKYAGHNPGYYHLVPPYLNAPEWQLRAAAAQIAGETKDISQVEKLSDLLKDKEWWVRMRAAQALVRIGTKGIQILKSQSIEHDQYAYEAATQALLDVHEGNN
jgi:hypothetical protein